MNFVDKDGTTKVYIPVHPCFCEPKSNKMDKRGAILTGAILIIIVEGYFIVIYFLASFLLCCRFSCIFLLTGLRIYTGEYKAQGPTLCPTEGRALRGPRALYSPV